MAEPSLYILDLAFAGQKIPRSGRNSRSNLLHNETKYVKIPIPTTYIVAHKNTKVNNIFCCQKPKPNLYCRKDKFQFIEQFVVEQSSEKVSF